MKLPGVDEAYDKAPELSNLLIDPIFREAVESRANSWRNVVATGILNGVPTPAMSAALNYFDGYKSEFLPVNLLQAQRDYFGAHTYERLDKPRGEYYHTNWTGQGSSAVSSI